MQELERCLELTEEIRELKTDLEELNARVLSPKNQILTGMPHGSNNLDNAMDRYLLKKEKLSEKISKLETQRDNLFNTFCEKAENNPDINEQDKHLMYLHFYKGVKWKRCAELMKNKYGKWNINKVFRVYRKINRII